MTQPGCCVQYAVHETVVRDDPIRPIMVHTGLEDFAHGSGQNDDDTNSKRSVRAGPLRPAGTYRHLDTGNAAVYLDDRPSTER